MFSYRNRIPFAGSASRRRRAPGGPHTACRLPPSPSVVLRHALRQAAEGLPRARLGPPRRRPRRPSFSYSASTRGGYLPLLRSPGGTRRQMNRRAHLGPPGPEPRCIQANRAAPHSHRLGGGRALRDGDRCYETKLCGVLTRPLNAAYNATQQRSVMTWN